MSETREMSFGNLNIPSKQHGRGGLERCGVLECSHVAMLDKSELKATKINHKQEAVNGESNALIRNL